MIDHIIETDTLIGISTDKIETLLGSAEWLTYNPVKKAHNPNKWNYNLGTAPGAFTSKKECLEITLQNGVVTKLRPFKDDITYKNEK